MKSLTIAFLCVVLLSAGPAAAQDRFFEIPLQDIELTDGTMPQKGDPVFRTWHRRVLSRVRVVLDGPGEGIIMNTDGDRVVWSRSFVSDSVLLLRVPGDADVTGRMVLPVRRKDPPRILTFRVPAAAASADLKADFLRAQEVWFNVSARKVTSGRGWLRYRSWALRRERLGPDAAAPPITVVRRSDRDTEMEKTFNLFTGGRAVAENLQLDRVLRPVAEDTEMVPLAGIEGITVEEVDWEPLLQGKDPKTDPLAASVPATQYAVFFKSLRGFNRLTDEARLAGAPVLSWLEARSSDARTWQRYQRQLCLSLEGLNRFIAPLLARSAVVTGTDPFLRTGSDVAVVIETDSDALFLYMALQHYAIRTSNPDARTEFGLRGRQVFYGLHTPDRRISSYVMRIPDVGLLVTNSMTQIDSIAAVMAGDEPAMLVSPEYRFFRDRYPLTERDETALLVVPDAAIRAWAGPRSRILSSRRIRVAAVLTMLQAEHLDALVAGSLPLGALDTPVSVPGAGRFVVEAVPGGQQIRSEVYGILGFLTPVSELPLEEATKAEANAYRWFQSRYQKNWRQYFDPLAVRFSLRAKTVDVDLSVFPLIANSEYRELIELTAGATMAEDGGDPHAGALFRYGMSIDHASSLFKEIGSFTMSVLPGVKGSAMSWLGDSLEVYLDDGPFWDELAAAADSDEFLEKNFHRIPAALRVGVSGAVEVSAFLAAFRGFVEQTAPGTLAWENRTHAGKTWVRIAPFDPEDEGIPKDLAIHYAVDRKRLLITLDEELMKRSLERSGGGAAQPWLGRQVGLQADGRVMDLLEAFDNGRSGDHVFRAAWSNLEILNEWRGRYPDHDPVAFHEAWWGVRLRDPAGGTYVWDPEWKTMSSEHYGHPAAPKAGPGLRRGPLTRVLGANLGLSFELGGLRARVRVTRSLP